MPSSEKPQQEDLRLECMQPQDMTHEGGGGSHERVHPWDGTLCIAFCCYCCCLCPLLLSSVQWSAHLLVPTMPCTTTHLAMGHDHGCYDSMSVPPVDTVPLEQIVCGTRVLMDLVDSGGQFPLDLFRNRIA